MKPVFEIVADAIDESKYLDFSVGLPLPPEKEREFINDAVQQALKKGCWSISSGNFRVMAFRWDTAANSIGNSIEVVITRNYKAQIIKIKEVHTP